jgi:hypothetical protein
MSTRAVSLAAENEKSTIQIDDFYVDPRRNS